MENHALYRVWLKCNGIQIRTPEALRKMDGGVALSPILVDTPRPHHYVVDTGT